MSAQNGLVVQIILTFETKTFKAWMLFKPVTYVLIGSLHNSFIVFSNSCIQNCKTDCMHVFLVLDQIHDTAPNSASSAEPVSLLSLQCPFTVEQMPCECEDLPCFAALQSLLVLYSPFQIQVATCRELLAWFSSVSHLRSPWHTGCLLHLMLSRASVEPQPKAQGNKDHVSSFAARRPLLGRNTREL